MGCIDIREIQIVCELQSRPSPVDSMREAVFTVSPNRQYLGIACPTTPAVHKITEHDDKHFPRCKLKFVVLQ